MVILFVSHVRILREALVTALQAPGDNQARSASCHETVKAALSECAPGLVVIDASHPAAAALVAAVRADAPAAKLVVMAASDQDEDFLSWAKTGLSGYIGPDASISELLSVVRRVGAGDVVCPPRLTAVLLKGFADRPVERADRAGIFALTSREQDILELIAEGLSNKLIARRLSVAVATVKNHVHSILDKWDCRSRGEAAARYRQHAQGHAAPSRLLPALRTGHALPPDRFPLRSGEMQHRVPAPFSRQAA